MPHGDFGTQHHCPGHREEVIIPGKGEKPRVVIPSGDCAFSKHPRRCVVHENYCQKHNWVYSKGQTCGRCDTDRQIKRDIAEGRRRDDEDEDRAGPSKDMGKGRKGKGKGQGKETTKNTKKTIAKKGNDKKSANTKKAIAIFHTLERWMTGIKQIDLDQLTNSDKHIIFPDPSGIEDPISVSPVVVAKAITPFLYDAHGMNFVQKAFLDTFASPEDTLRLWMTGIQNIDLEQLKRSDKDVILVFGFKDTHSVQPIEVLNAIAPFLHDEHGLNFTQNAAIAIMETMKSQELHRYHLRPRERIFGPAVDSDADADSGYNSELDSENFHTDHDGET